MSTLSYFLCGQMKTKPPPQNTSRLDIETVHNKLFIQAATSAQYFLPSPVILIYTAPRNHHTNCSCRIHPGQGRLLRGKFGDYFVAVVSMFVIQRNRKVPVTVSLPCPPNSVHTVEIDDRGQLDTAAVRGKRQLLLGQGDRGQMADR